MKSVQDIPLDIKKCQLEVLLENLYTMVNAPYLYVLEFKPPAPFSIQTPLNISVQYLHAWHV